MNPTFFVLGLSVGLVCGLILSRQLVSVIDRLRLVQRTTNAVRAYSLRQIQRITRERDQHEREANYWMLELRKLTHPEPQEAGIVPVASPLSATTSVSDLPTTSTSFQR